MMQFNERTQDTLSAYIATTNWLRWRRVGGWLSELLAAPPMGQNMLTDGCASPPLTLAAEPKQQISGVANRSARAC